VVARSQKIDLATLLFLIPGLGEWLYTRLRRDPQAAYQTLAPYYSHLDELPEADREFLFQRVNERVWSDGQRRAFFSTFRNLARWLPGQQRDLPSRLSALGVPTLVVWGEADRINLIENGRALAELQPTARLVVVPGAGHDVHQEDAVAVLEAIRTWMAPAS
jgi:pimeloyl-ACP methyl ester carboxylesterase